MAGNFIKTRFYPFIFCVLIIQICASALNAQSTNQNFPTPVTASEISGRISARDIGDSRLTTYFYTFNGTQGDVFVNVEATNLNGDIDVFTVGNLRPLTKISIYAGDTTIETGRVIYLRKSEKLILRVQGRTPNDNAATFRIKFAGSFVASDAKDESDEPKLPEVKTNENSGIKVNSVGTIIEVKPKPTPKPKETVAEKEDETVSEKEETKSDEKTDETKAEKSDDVKEESKSEEKKEENKETEKVEEKSETIAEKESVKSEIEKVKTPEKTSRKNRRKAQVKPTETKIETSEQDAENKEVKVDVKEETKAGTTEKTTVKSSSKTRKSAKQKSKELEPNPLENVRLTVLFKDGTKFEKPMTEVIRFSVDKGTLTIITKDGKIERFQIVNVAKMTVE